MKNRQWIFFPCILLAVSAMSSLWAQGEILGVVPVGKTPVAVAINPATNQAFVLNRGSQDVMVINMTSRAVVQQYRVGGIPAGIAVNPRTNTFVVVSLNSEMTIIDHGQGRIVGTIPVGKAPSRVAIDAERNVALVTNFNGSNMAVVDIKYPSRVIRTIDLKNGPLGVLALEGSGRAIVAAQYDMEILQVDLNLGTIDQRCLVGRYLSDLALNPATGQVVFVNPTNNGIMSVYDPGTNSVISTLPMGAGPLAVAVYPKQNVALVSEFNGGTVTLVDLELSRVIKSITVGKGPAAVAINPETGVAVVVSRLANSATFLDLNVILNEVNTQ